MPYTHDSPVHIANHAPPPRPPDPPRRCRLRTGRGLLPLDRRRTKRDRGIKAAPAHHRDRHRIRDRDSGYDARCAGTQIRSNRYQPPRGSVCKGKPCAGRSCGSLQRDQGQIRSDHLQFAVSPDRTG